MSRVKLTVAILGLLALAFLLRWQLAPDEEDIPTDFAVSKSESPPDTPTEERAPQPSVEPSTAATVLEASREAVEVQAPAATTLQETLTLFGRTIDQNDQPLAGVKVRIQGYKVWTEGIDVPRLPGKYDMRGFELATDADGRFRFDVPKPTVSPVTFTIEPDPFHDSVRLTFGGPRDDSKPPITRVAADLGDFRLATTGAIRGRITDGAGKAIENAELHVGKEAVYTIGRNGTSDSSGAYVIEHVPPGSQGVAVKCEGYLAQFKKPVEVLAGRYVDAVDFALLPAPSLRGFVVDDAGAPVEGVRLWGWPKGQGSGAGSKSQADGSFTIYLPQNEPYTLEATKDGFQPYHVNDRSVHFDPGTENLRVELVRAKGWEILVVDAATSKPLEQFGFQVLVGNSMHALNLLNGSMSGKAPSKMEWHPGGIARAELRPGVDVLSVSANGYRDKEVDFEPDFAIGTRIVVKLTASAGVSGRLMRGSEPASGLRIALDCGDFLPGMAPKERRSGQLDGTKPQAPADRPTFNYRPSSKVFAISDAEGRFHFVGMARGNYLLLTTDGESLAIDHAPIVVGNDPVDLGDVGVVTGAVLSGQLIAPAGRSVSGLRIRLDEYRTGGQETLNAEGRFRFVGLAAGIHRLSVDDVPGSIVAAPPMEVELASGEQREVVYDLSRAGSCQVTLTVLVNSLPAANADVELSTVAADGSPGTNGRVDASGRPCDFYRLGRTDANGRVNSSAPVRGTARVHVWFGEGPRVEHPDLELSLMLDAPIEATVAYEMGRLLVVLPDAIELPEQATMQVVLRQGGDRKAVQTFHANGDQRSKSRNVAFERVLTGQFEVETSWTAVARMGGARTELYRGSENAVIRPGETTEVRLR